MRLIKREEADVAGEGVWFAAYVPQWHEMEPYRFDPLRMDPTGRKCCNKVCVVKTQNPS